MDISQLTENFKNFDELKLFTESQFKQILALTKKNRELEDKITELNKKSRETPKQEIIQQTSGNLVTPDFKVLDDAKTISQVQLKMIKELALIENLLLKKLSALKSLIKF